MNTKEKLTPHAVRNLSYIVNTSSQDSITPQEYMRRLFRFSNPFKNEHDQLVVVYISGKENYLAPRGSFQTITEAEKCINKNKKLDRKYKFASKDRGSYHIFTRSGNLVQA